MDTDTTTEQPSTTPAPGHPEDRSTRPVIEHALTVYFDGNAELARTLIDRLIAEQGGE